MQGSGERYQIPTTHRLDAAPLDHGVEVDFRVGNPNLRPFAETQAAADVQEAIKVIDLRDSREVSAAELTLADLSVRLVNLRAEASV